MKKFIALILLVAFSTQTFSRSFLVLDYFANKKAFIEKCENKARPWLHCNGQCLLMKKLNAEKKQDEKNPERKAENKAESTISSRSFFPHALAVPVSTCTLANITLSENTRAGFPCSFFHPPRS